MRLAHMLIMGFGLLAAAGSALAEAAPAAPGTSLDGVDVVAPPPRDPKVVSAFPSDGGQVAAGVVILKITFDQPMTADAWAYAKSDKGAFPQCLARPRLLRDRKSFALLCTVRPQQTYAIEINAAPGFVSAAGRAALPYVLSFTTTSDTVSALHDALIKAGLTDDDAPIMDWNGAEGISTRAPAPTDPSVKTP